MSEQDVKKILDEGGYIFTLFGDLIKPRRINTAGIVASCYWKDGRSFHNIKYNVSDLHRRATQEEVEKYGIL